MDAPADLSSTRIAAIGAIGTAFLGTGLVLENIGKNNPNSRLARIAAIVGRTLQNMVAAGVIASTLSHAVVSIISPLISNVASVALKLTNVFSMALIALPMITAVSKRVLKGRALQILESIDNVVNTASKVIGIAVCTFAASAAFSPLAGLAIGGALTYLALSPKQKQKIKKLALAPFHFCAAKIKSLFSRKQPQKA